LGRLGAGSPWAGEISDLPTGCSTSCCDATCRGAARGRRGTGDDVGAQSTPCGCSEYPMWVLGVPRVSTHSVGAARGRRGRARFSRTRRSSTLKGPRARSSSSTGDPKRGQTGPCRFLRGLAPCGSTIRPTRSACTRPCSCVWHAAGSFPSSARCRSARRRTRPTPSCVCAQSWCISGRGGPSPGADVGGASPVTSVAPIVARLAMGCSSEQS
jgi:hypothetical protein